MEKENEKVNEKIKNKKLSKKALVKYLEENHKNTETLKKYLKTSLRLINGFGHINTQVKTYNEKNKFNLKEFVVENIKIIEDIMKIKGRNIIIDIPKNIKLSISKSKLLQVLLNLIKNAMTHGLKNKENGEIKISAKKEKNIILSIRDNGKGIKKEYIKKIFDKNFKISESGSGLGLFIVKEIVKNDFKGKIDVNSQLNDYTEFIIKIPEKGVVNE
ncbi:MAG: sensor histidine kinase [Bacillota bacterium]